MAVQARVWMVYVGQASGLAQSRALISLIRINPHHFIAFPIPDRSFSLFDTNGESAISVQNASFCQRDEEKTRHEAGKVDLEGSGCL